MNLGQGLQKYSVTEVLTKFIQRGAVWSRASARGLLVDSNRLQASLRILDLLADRFALRKQVQIIRAAGFRVGA